MLRKKCLICVMLITMLGLVGCSRQVGKEEAVSDSVVGDSLEMTTEVPADASEESVDSEVEEEKSETTPQPVETPEPPKERYIDFTNVDVCFRESDIEAIPLAMTVVSEKENNVSEIPGWLSENQLSLPMLGGSWSLLMNSSENSPTVSAEMMLYGTAFYDENYIYDWTSTGLNIYDRNSCQQLYAISYQMDQWYMMGNCAYLQDGILYLGYLYNGYAMTGTCYLLAYDIENETVLWRSEDQTYNTMNFIVKDDIIICGYGFTAEKDYIYQIDRNTGKVISKTELQKMPEMLVEKNGQLYVHTYSYDYVLDVGVDG